MCVATGRGKVGFHSLGAHVRCGTIEKYQSQEMQLLAVEDWMSDMVSQDRAAQNES